MMDKQGANSRFAAFSRLLAKAGLSSGEAALKGLAKVWSKRVCQRAAVPSTTWSGWRRPGELPSGCQGRGFRMLQDKDSRIFPWIASRQAESMVLVMGSTRRNGMKS